MDFNKIIGHERQIEIFKKSIEENTVSHSYLFEGEEGLGKRKVAQAFSKALLCKGHGEKPCNVCSSCIKFDTENHPDFKMLSATNGKIAKKEINTLISSIPILPFESERKVYVIDGGDGIRLDSQNTLLKTLEEPPEYIVIIMITSNVNKIIPTIISRCQNIKFHLIHSEKIRGLLNQKYDLGEEKSKVIVSFANGSIKKALELAESDEFFQIREQIIDIINQIINGNKVKIFTASELLNKNKDNIEELLDIFMYWFRDLLIYKELGDSSLIVNKDKIGILSEQSFLDMEKINDIIYTIEMTKINIKRNINFNLSIETMLLNI